MILDALLFCRIGKLAVKDTPILKVFPRIRECFERFLRFRAEVFNIFCLPFAFCLFKTLFGLPAVNGNLRVFLRDERENLINLILKLEIALFLASVLHLHDEIRDRAEHALSGVAATRHRDPLEDTGNILVTDIVKTGYIEAVYIESLFPDGTGSDHGGRFPVRREFIVRHGCCSKQPWFENHFEFSSIREFINTRKRAFRCM